jgi:hypothetical protein
MSADAEDRVDRPREPPLADAPTVAPDDQGGDAACWLGRVCDTCGALIEGSRGVPCWRCNTPWTPA